MSKIVQAIRNLLGSVPAAAPTSATFVPAAFKPSHFRIRDLTRFAEGDRVLIQDGRPAGNKLSPPLKQDAVVSVKSGSIRYNDIIGQRIGRLSVTTSKADVVHVSYPSLNDYVSQTPRRVQPIYASYAASIVDLLDIHVSPLASSEHRLEVLDAGTGHGSLAIHLARAIAAANPAPPDLPVPELRLTSSASLDASNQHRQQTDLLTSWAKYRDSRSAVVHTMDCIAANSIHAEKIVRGFRQGLYWPHIDFHTARVGTWIREQSEKRGSFLSYASLDLPNVHEEIAAVTQALLPDAKLSIFAPSVSQIAECQLRVQTNNLPIYLEQVRELGEGISTGRTWDLRYVHPRARGKALTEAAEASDAHEETDSGDQLVDGLKHPAHANGQTDNKVLICRPKVGLRTFGGGFVGLWRKGPRPSTALL